MHMLYRLCSVAVAAVALAAGCVSETYAPTPPGEAIVRWTVAETTDPGACSDHDAPTFDVKLYGSAGNFAGEWQQDCTAFATTIYDLVPDDYTGDAVLLSSSGSARTTTVRLGTFSVIPAATVVVDVDFPADSFY